jgi:hypothetical protein
MSNVLTTISLPCILLLAAGCACNEDMLQVQDSDKDGHTAMTDCNDQDPEIYPGAEEVCDGVDNNCDGEVDEGVGTIMYADTDGDTFGDPESMVNACDTAEGYVENSDDCDDTLDTVYPDAEELCDGIDNDCDTEIDEDLDRLFFLDTDKDGYGDPEESTTDCKPPEGYVDDNQDCDDTKENIHPGALEICSDDIDQDCDGYDNACNVDGWMDLDSDADISFLGDAAGDNAGASVSLLPDFDGDGRAEVAVGAYGNDSSGNWGGIAYLIDFKDTFPMRGLVHLKEDDVDYDRWVFRSDSADFHTGTQIEHMGDVDGDGAADLAVSSPYNNLGGYAGAVSIFRAADIAGSPGSYDSSDAAAVLYASKPGERLGTDIHLAGDINNDGFDDFIIGGYMAQAPGTRQGRAYVIYGCETGLGDCRSSGSTYTSTYSWKSTAGVSIETVADAYFEGVNYENRVGSAVSGGEDFNGDGTVDVLIGASHENAHLKESGAVYVISDFPTVSTNIQSAASVRLTGVSYYDGAGTSVAFAGDVNSDGYADVLVGAPNYGSDENGAAYLVLGQNSDFEISLSEAEAILTGEGRLQYAGNEVAGLGDLDGDGQPEYAVGARKGRGSSNEENAGRVYIFREAVSGTVSLGAAATTYGGAILSGVDASGLVGSSIAGHADVNGNGHVDLLIGAQGFNGPGAAFLLFGGAK